MEIPLVDLRAQYRALENEIRQALAGVIGRASFILGDEVKEFEEAFARFCGVRYCIGVGSGTDALELALRALGVVPGDEVILPTNTFIATATAAVRAGATPVLVDADEESFLVDEDQVAEKIRTETKVIIPVHLFGQVVPIEAFQPVAAEAGISILEDAAQAQGARRNGRTVGGFGAAAATSFYPSKNIGAYGDAGAVLTNSEEIARAVRTLRNFGREAKYQHPEIGFNSRLDSIQAAILRVKLEHLAGWNEARRVAARRYDELLQDVDEVRRPKTLPGNEHVWHLYVVRVPARDEVFEKLNQVGIEAGIHYPVPIHLQGAFRFLDHKEGDFPVAEAVAKEILSLPIYPEITADQQERVVEELIKAIR